MLCFSCTTIDGVLRLYEDLEVVCYQDSHLIIVLGIALPALIFWGK